MALAMLPLRRLRCSLLAHTRLGGSQHRTDDPDRTLPLNNLGRLYQALGDYLAALARTIELAPRLVLPGHGEPIEDAAGRARELIAHHERRLERTIGALSPEPRTGFDVSHALFGGELAPTQRRFAVAETLSHLERLVHDGRARRHDAGETVGYSAP